MEYNSTIISSIKPSVKDLRDFFNSGQTNSYEWRISQIKALKAMIKENEDLIFTALEKDNGKSPENVFSTETFAVCFECNDHVANLKSWMRPKKVPTDILNIGGSSEIRHDSMGVVTIFSASNYPFRLAAYPMVGALAAGNCILLKPSELCPATAMVLTHLISKYLDPRAVKVVNGGIPVSREILDCDVDKIFFTGSTSVGSIVAQSAAKKLIPVVLELGGKNPVIVDATADIPLAARRLVWAKCLNSGQTCVAPDHLFVHESVAEKLKTEVQRYTNLHWPDMMNNKDYTRAQSLTTFRRLTAIIESEKKFKVFGGASNEATLMVEFALFDYGNNADAFRNSALMSGEIFGPLIPMMTYTDVEPILRSIQKFDKPLSLYCFTRSRSLRERVAKYTTSGQLVFNDFNMQMANANLPFGGVGKSGQGSYHGYHSFKAFTHTKAVLYKSGFLDIPFRYPPWNGYPVKIFILKQLVMDRPMWLINSVMTIIHALPFIILVALVYTFKY